MCIAARRVGAALLLVVAMTIGGCGGAGVLPAVNIHGAGFGFNASGTVRLWVRAGMAGAYQFPDTQYVTKFATAVRGRDVPDVIGIDDINSTLLVYHDALTRSDRLSPPVELLNIEVGTQGQVDYGLLTAGAVVAMVPCVVLYIALQRYYVRGLASGAVKG
jgi:hypothetical protein